MLLLAYGAPASLDDVGPYLRDIRGGRPTPSELVAEMRSRYARIGGSPLLERTEEQAARLAETLGPPWRVAVGMRHWQPRIGDALEGFRRDGVRRVIAIPMAPHYSGLSVGAYRGACEAAPSVAGGALRLAFVGGWSDHPKFVDSVVERTRERLTAMPAEVQPRTIVLFTAHSLPERVIAEGDPYREQLLATASRVAERLCLSHWRLAFQSAGARDEPWLGPSAGEAIARAAAEGYRGVLVVPMGFVCDHVEILYDVDVAYRECAERLGLTFARTESLNAHPRLIEALADLARAAAREAGWP